jgi:hypothetical protein
MEVFDVIGRRIAHALLILASAMAFAPNANASFLLNFSVTPSSISTEGTATLDLQLMRGPPTGVGAGFDTLTGIDVIFSSGDGQTFHLVQTSGIFPFIPADFQHQFTYATAGVFSPEVTGSVSSAETTAVAVEFFTQPLDLTSSLQVNSVEAAVPEPSTWAMMILGFCGIGFMAYRKRKDGLALAAA